jgi:predicted metal-dependent phosphoesterase TrpH
MLKLYRETIVPLKDYIFGTYRLPECLVTTTVIGGNISVLNKNLDSPVLYTDSEELYINNILEYYKETGEDFSNSILYYFHLKLAELGKFKKIEDLKNKTTIFIDNSSGKPFIFKIPDLSDY